MSGVTTGEFDRPKAQKNNLINEEESTMKRKERFLILGLCALISFSVVCATNVFAADKVTITGTVYSAAWDENDNVIAATIVAGTGEEYAIVDNAAGKELLKLEYKVVKASGVIGEDSEGNKTFSVTNYEVMPE